MFRIVYDPSSGSINLYLNEIRSGSLMFVVCLIEVWQRNFEPIMYEMTKCSKHVFTTENPSFVAESRVGRVVNFIKCQSWERKFKDACCM